MNPQVEVGDSKQKDFYPQVKFMKHQNECNFSVRYQDFKPVKGLTQKVTDDFTLLQGDQHVHMYPKTVDFREEHLKDKYPADFYLGDIKTSKTDITIDGEQIALDSKEERETLKKIASEAYGDVLIVGLGLGLADNYFDKVTYVEINPDVIANYKGKNEVIQADYFEWAKTTDRKFDYIYGDIFPFFKVGYIEDWKRFNDISCEMLNPEGTVKTYIDDWARQIEQQDYTQKGYELEVILFKKPKTNVFKFSLQYKNVDFYYQPELTQDEIKQGAFRPESVVGSYAVYGNKKGGKYNTGKIAHIYRPKIFDKHGDWVWGELKITKSTMKITVPQEFLDNAVYPLTIDPTFGYTTIGGTQTGVGNIIFGTQATGVADTGNAIFFYCGSSTSSARLVNGGVYKQSDETLETNSQTNQDFGAPSTWLELPFTVQPTFSAIGYWISAQGGFSSTKKGTTQIFAMYDSGGAGVGFTTARAYTSTMPNPIPAYVADTRIYSMYVDVGTPPPPKVTLINDDY